MTEVLPQVLSVTEGATQVTAISLSAAPSSTVFFSGQLRISGLVMSLMVTAMFAVPMLPEESVAVHVTMCSVALGRVTSNGPGEEGSHI